MEGEETASPSKSDAAKAHVAQRLRQETSVMHAWIAQERIMGTASTVPKAFSKLAQNH